MITREDQDVFRNYKRACFRVEAAERELDRAKSDYENAKARISRTGPVNSRSINVLPISENILAQLSASRIHYIGEYIMAEHIKGIGPVKRKLIDDAIESLRQLVIESERDK